MPSSYWSSRSATQRKNAQTSSNPSSSGPVIHLDIDPSPNPRPIYQFLAIGFIIFLGFLQLFPATYIRHPLDPFRKWIPVTSTPSSSSSSNNLIRAWGLDMQLGYCAQGDRTKNVGVVDFEYIVHLGLPTLGVLDDNEDKGDGDGLGCC